MTPDPTPDDIAAATAECGMQALANWLPAEQHGMLRELLYDLVFTALHVNATRPWQAPEPSTN